MLFSGQDEDGGENWKDVQGRTMSERCDEGRGLKAMCERDEIRKDAYCDSK